MSGPKFSVGQRVAVCTKTLSVVLPETTVVAIAWTDASISRGWEGVHMPVPAGFVYRVADALFNPRGRPHWFHEKALRPLNDDDYKDTAEDSAVPASGVRA